MFKNKNNIIKFIFFIIIIINTSFVEISGLRLLFNCFIFIFLILLELFWKKLSYKFLVVIISALSILFGLCLFGNNLKAKWWIIDDHEVIAIMGKDNKLTLKEFFYVYSNTEAGKPGLSVRYRPSYYFLRLAETSVWSNKTFLWYLFRLVIFTSMIFTTWMLIGKWTGYGVGGAFTLNIMSFEFWSDVFSRLGPGEAYCVFGLMFLILGVYFTYKKNVFRRNFGWFLILTGAMISVGSKENFIFILLPLFLIYFDLFKKKKITKFSSLMFLFTTAYILFIGISIFVAINNSGKDIYSNSISFTNRIKLLLVAATTKMGIFLNIISVITLIMTFSNKIKNKSFFKRKKMFAVIFVLWLFYYFNFVFYNGIWPTGGRYDFPAILILPISMLILYKFIFFKNKLSEKLFLLCLLFIPFLNVNFFKIRESSKINVFRTQLFTNKVVSIAENAKQFPNKKIVFEVGAIFDYEPIVSYQRFFYNAGVTNEMYLLSHIEKTQIQTPLDETVFNYIKDISENGLESFLPYDIDPNDSNCIAIQIHGDWPTNCEKIDVSDVTSLVK